MGCVHTQFAFQEIIWSLKSARASCCGGGETGVVLILAGNESFCLYQNIFSVDGLLNEMVLGKHKIRSQRDAKQSQTSPRFCRFFNVFIIFCVPFLDIYVASLRPVLYLIVVDPQKLRPYTKLIC